MTSPLFIPGTPERRAMLECWYNEFRQYEAWDTQLGEQVRRWRRELEGVPEWWNETTADFVAVRDDQKPGRVKQTKHQTKQAKEAERVRAEIEKLERWKTGA